MEDIKKLEKFVIHTSLPISAIIICMAFYTREIIFYQLGYIFLAIMVLHLYSMGYIKIKESLK